MIIRTRRPIGLVALSLVFLFGRLAAAMPRGYAPPLDLQSATRRQLMEDRETEEPEPTEAPETDEPTETPETDEPTDAPPVAPVIPSPVAPIEPTTPPPVAPSPTLTFPPVPVPQPVVPVAVPVPAPVVVPTPTDDVTPPTAPVPVPAPVIGGTPPPVPAPVVSAPVVASSILPSDVPSDMPSKAPTSNPTANPTFVPTTSPSASPSTSAPTQASPSMAPSVPLIDVPLLTTSLFFVVRDEELVDVPILEQEINTFMTGVLESQLADVATFEESDVSASVLAREVRRNLREQVNVDVIMTAFFTAEPRPTTMDMTNDVISYFESGTGYTDLEAVLESDATGIMNVTNLAVSVGGSSIVSPAEQPEGGDGGGGGANGGLIGGLVAAGCVLVAAGIGLLVVRKKRKSEDFTVQDGDDVPPGDGEEYLAPVGAEGGTTGEEFEVDIGGLGPSQTEDDESLYTSATKDTDEKMEESLMGETQDSYDPSRLDALIGSAKEQLETPIEEQDEEDSRRASDNVDL